MSEMTKMTNKITKFATLMGATALTALVFPANMTMSQTIDCTAALIEGVLPIGCEQPNAASTDNIAIGENTERGLQRIDNSLGFVLAIDGEVVDGDPTIVNQVRKTDVALAKADVRVTFDGLDVKPRLDIQTVGAIAGQTVTLESSTNYPAFIDRAEVRVFATSEAGTTRLVQVVPIQANGQAGFAVLQGQTISVIHRVYGANGRFDETERLALSGLSAATNAEEGIDRTARRNIAVSGGAVTVSAANMTQGSRLETLGETVRPDGSGRLVIQRILPPGDYEVDVVVQGGGQNTQLTRDVAVANSEWFYIGTADLTYARLSGGESNATTTQTTARLSYYVDGKTASGYQITSSVDTGEQAVEDLFRRLDEKDPRSVAGRLDPSDGYPTYGDDSTSVDNTPTSGKFYLRVERDGNHALWGDYKSSVNGSSFLRNERSLYGAQVVLTSSATTTNGDPVFEAEIYAAQPDQLVGRENFRGTGGSVYFLQRQDVSVGSETLTVEIRDVDTGRVLERRTLVYGLDYEINYFQGVIVLTSPLSAQGTGNLIETNAGGDTVANLVAQYEFSPTSSDVNGFSYGGRAQAWVSDSVRLGATAMNDSTGSADQESAAIDLRYVVGNNSYVQLDYARTEGPGFGSSSSLNGGQITDNTVATAGSGDAVKLDAYIDLADMGSDRNGGVSGYFEKRSEGFSTLDYQVTSATGDEMLYGFAVNVEAEGNALGFRIYGDRYENTVGAEKTTLGAELKGRVNDRLAYVIGGEYVEEAGATIGDRFDVAGRLSYALNNGMTVAAFGQTTVNNNGLDDTNRYGVAVGGEVNDRWTVEAEISDGTGGIGGRVLATYARDADNSVYFGYDIDPDRSISRGYDPADAGGRYVIGGRQQVTDDLSYYGENTYDLFGETTSLTTAYGANYRQTDNLSFTAGFEMGQVEEAIGNFDQKALSFGVAFNDEDLEAQARLEFRRDRGEISGTNRDADTIALIANATYQIDENQRLLVTATAIDTQTDEADILNGRLVDASLGYAYRPIDNERLNVLARYRYLDDDFGQEIDGTAGSGSIQRSHVFSVEGNYDIDEYWTVGAKLGGRFTDSAASRGDDLVSNDAWIAIANARYNLTGAWDALIEVRHFDAVDAGLAETSFLGAVYRDVGQYTKVGVGYNFGRVSDDLTDLTNDDEGLFLNVVASF